MSLKKLNIKNSELINKLIEKVASLTGGVMEEGLRYKYDYSNGVYEPVYLRVYAKNEDSQFYRIIISRGYTDSEGDFHSDPEVHIGVLSKYNQFFPFYVKTGEGENEVDKRSAEFDVSGHIIWQNTNENQRDVHSFTNSLLNQIRKQYAEFND